MIFLFNVMIYYCYASVVSLMLNGRLLLDSGNFKNIGIFCLMPIFFRLTKISLLNSLDLKRVGMATLKRFGKKYFLLSLIAVFLPVWVVNMIEKQNFFLMTENQWQFLLFFLAISMHFCYHEIVKKK